MSGDSLSAFPLELRQAEALLIAARREANRQAEDPPAEKSAADDDRIGVALSGGGIRSATFCLGVFQGLAKLGLLRRIDYLSTVSGGGYFGAFYGRLFTRDQVRSALDVEDLLRSDAPEDRSRMNGTSPAPDGPSLINWLRENGRYLAPRGSGDYLIALAVLLRNWFAVQAVALLFLLTIVLALTLVVASTEVAVPGIGSFARTSLGYRFGGNGWPLWGSPLLAIPAGLFVGLLFPLNWAYWIASLRWRAPGMPRPAWTQPLAGPIAISLGLLASLASLMYWGKSLAAPAPWLMLLGAALSLFAIVLWLLAKTCAVRRRTGTGTGDKEQDALHHSHEVTKLLTAWLSVWLKWSLLFLALGLIDSVGRTLYALWSFGTFALTQWIVALVTAVALAVARGQTLIGGLAGDGQGKWKLPIRWIAAAAGVVLFLLILLLLDMTAHALTWQLRPPANMPDAITRYVELLHCQAQKDACPLSGLFPPIATSPVASWIGLLPAFATFVVLLVLSLYLGTQWEFLNRSTLQPLYGARLARAYLGASNAQRHTDRYASVTDPIADDDIREQEYWGAEHGPWTRGGPLHLVNVTINETILGRSQIEQQDRCGVGMAKGPCALSVGARHHRMNLQDGDPIWPRDGYRVFGEPGERPQPEPMVLSLWAGISGAAFSTGMGFQTHVGLSLLTGLLNVRLGYWWDSGVAGGRWHGSRLFSVQRYLISNEWFARFPGPARRHWYLSDGGHFENTAAYELIRRRLPLIVVVDAGADPDHQLDDVANLVRKARIDFGAEIDFLSAPELQRMSVLRHEASHQCCYFGTLNELRSGIAVEPWKEGEKEHEISIERLPCAALAKVNYADAPGRSSWLVVLKPTVSASDPSDLVNYRRVNPIFPNETTVDQFFDEAQWESYRKLGELIATRVFSRPRLEPADGDPLALLR